jgi:hypothetical protein
LALVSLLAQQTIFGWDLPYGMPLWVGVIGLVIAYTIAASVVRALRYGASPHATGNAGWAAVHTVVWICSTLLLFWLAYTFIPGVSEIVDQVSWAVNLTFENITQTIV